MKILPVRAEDLPAILALQKQAFESEARLVGSYEIPPMTQTLADLEQEFAALVMLKAVMDDGEIAGAVRAKIENATAHVGRLMVKPGFQGQGIGTRLLAAIEKTCAQDRYELFTSAKNRRNVALYEKAGYYAFKEVEVMPGVRLVWLQKSGCFEKGGD
ncbi:GNAT family N-acetyltransferase [Desulfovibrio sp. 86]|uniref:Acetyltransferase, GNAT family n=1 Tax=uncultured Desulfovibrio sp. TaxID=167968 RepID=A0A212L5H7_9BACT|nr:GNAT family N-acetyltransferase [Desulfovibrio sp. 86]SCM72776.1 Acetyltransferase, GNAT family [uncultured Desulfovibrio sp.]VZH33734.1 Acetyltransferase, GNAT family [Desulfovibrio sp. 86]